MSDRIVVPFIWVPHGQKPDPADLARFSQPVRVPAWFVRRKPAVAEEPPPEDQAHGWDESWDTEAGAIPAGTDPAEPVWEPSGYDLPQADPIAAFLRVEAALGRMGFTNVIRRADAGRSEDGFTTLAQMMVPGPPTEERLNERPASTIAAARYIADDPLQWIRRPSSARASACLWSSKRPAPLGLRCGVPALWFRETPPSVPARPSPRSTAADTTPAMRRSTLDKMSTGSR